jgi:hypothetical protein
MMPKLFIRFAFALAGGLVAAACSDGVGPAPPPSITVAPDSHSIQVGETRQFTATWRDPSDVTRLPSLIVWSTINPAIATVSVDGLVTGLKAGATRVIASADGIADTSAIEVRRTPGQLTIQPPGLVAPGDVVRLGAIVTDTEGAVMIGAGVGWSVSAPEVATVDAEGWLTGHGEGTVVVTGVAAPISSTLEIEVRVPPPIEGCESGGLTLQVGEARHYSGAVASSLCLSGEGEYLLVAANAGSVTLETSIQGEGISPLVAPAAAGLLAERSLGGQAGAVDPLDWTFERDLRRREREQLSPGAARSRTLMRALQAAAPLAVGDLLPLSAASECDSSDVRTGRVQFVGQHSIVVADTANPAGGLSAADYAHFGTTYDTLLHAVVTDHFGEPAGMNGETRVMIFYTRAVNELTSADADGVVGGYFWAGDLFPRTACAGSNEREMFYVLAADPSGTINGNVRTVEYVQRATAGTIAHELQHLVNASRRIHINDSPVWEETWLNEGMSHIAEELVFYRALGATAGQNLGPTDIGSTPARVDVMNRYAISNLLRFDRYLEDHERQGPFQQDDDLATRGASWQYLRYALDRRGGDARVHLSSLVNSMTAGLANLEAVFGADPRDWFVDDMTALYADDTISGIDSRYRHPSWNFRPIFNWIGDGYSLKPRVLQDTVPTSLTLQGWGTAYLRTAVRAGRVARVQLGDESSPPADSMELVLVRTR